MAYPTPEDERVQERLDRARKDCLQQLREFIGGGEAWPAQFEPLLEALEEVMEAKMEYGNFRSNASP